MKVDRSIALCSSRYVRRVNLERSTMKVDRSIEFIRNPWFEDKQPVFLYEICVSNRELRNLRRATLGVLHRRTTSV